MDAGVEYAAYLIQVAYRFCDRSILSGVSNLGRETHK